MLNIDPGGGGGGSPILIYFLNTVVINTGINIDVLHVCIMYLHIEFNYRQQVVT